MERIALLYAADAYQLPAPAAPGDPKNFGLKGRHVAGKEFFDALMRHGRWKHLTAVTLGDGDERAINETWRRSPPELTSGRQLRAVPLARLGREFLASPPAPVLHFPNPPDAKFAWVRRHTNPHSFALTGVTHTICTDSVVRMITDYVTAPMEEYDCLICTSRAAERSVRAIATNYADYLADRFGGRPELRLRLEVIPLGVDVAKYRPAFDDERAQMRKLFGVAADEFAVLSVGRLSFHSKAHPFAMYRALAEASKRTGKKVHLLMSGKAVSAAIDGAFRTGARDFADGVRVTFVDGAHPTHPRDVWKAADLFASLSDSIQETFGLALLEAQASGLAAVASDWDGYRDIVADGETGLLVPTFVLRDATRGATTRLLTGETNYDHFLGECNQSVVVDESAAVDAFARLMTDDAARNRMGEAARRRVMERFAWAKVIGAYEYLWESLDRQRVEVAKASTPPRLPTPECYPPPEVSFAAYPSAVWTGGEMVRLNADGLARLEQLLQHPLTGYKTAPRVVSPEAIRKALGGVIGAATVDEVAGRFVGVGADREPALATVAWLLKYRVLERDG